jgi:hypothetical protein
MTNPQNDLDALDLERLGQHPVKLKWFFENVAPVIADLKKRIEALEKRPAGMKWTGTWSEHHARSVGYERDEAVTVGGSLWVCRGSGVTEKPGTSAMWQLAVKEGRVNSAEQRGQR